MKAERDDELVLLMGGQRAGTIVQGDDGRLTLTYHDHWRNDPTATPLSLSMPLSQPSHGDSLVRSYLWGLLPDNERVLERWARQYQVSALNPFALLRHVGEDCAGAAQFVRSSRVDALRAGEGGVEWLDDAVIADRLRALRRDPTAWHAATAGQFSLAGAQAKTALHFDPATRQWGDPWGAVPTTHILKPAVVGLDDHDLNEHLCLETARMLRLNAAYSQVEVFRGERAIVIERYDRDWSDDGHVRRIHQEDVCQAHGLPPTAKYQSDGGPGPEQIMDLLGREVRPGAVAAVNIERFIAAVAFSWIVGGTDAHAKNYSILLATHQVRLAPMYDVASALPYDNMYVPKLRMAMRIGGEYRLEAISGRHWRRLAEACGLDPDRTVTRIRDLVARTPDAMATAVNAEPVRALRSDLPTRLLDRVSARTRQCRQALDR